MSTTTQRETPVPADSSSLNPDAVKHLSTAVASRSEKGMINLSKEKIENLKSKVKGQIVLPSDSSYDEVREIWNAMIERRPALIVRCAEADDVPPAISFARENRLEISIRGAGHNIAGNALCDNGVMIDFSTMRQVRVDAGKKRAYVEPGATLGRTMSGASPGHVHLSLPLSWDFKNRAIRRGCDPKNPAHRLLRGRVR